MSIKIILLDDIQEKRKEVLTALKSELGKRGTVMEFQAGASGITEGIYEERLEADLKSKLHRGDSLIVADRDLSRYTTSYPGLSESTVQHVADKMGLPQCGYARGEKEEQFLESAERKESRIHLSVRDLRYFAKQVVDIAEGFAVIGTRLRNLSKKYLRQDPGEVLAQILDKSDEAGKISLYASGDQNRMAGLTDVSRLKTYDERIRRFACTFGYWLWDSVLRFPGVVVNEIAAASYLNIDINDFGKLPVRNLFSAARYEGPFSKAKGPLWWRSTLDGILERDSAKSGKNYVEKKLGRAIRRSKCCEDGTKPAGYYCFLSQRAVSRENSRPGLAWFPRGADLSRISKSHYARYGPWL